jgi:3-dehydroquinate synthase
MRFDTTQPIKTVLVELSERTYPIHIGENLVDAIPGWLGECFPKSRHCVLFVDANVVPLAQAMSTVLTVNGIRCTVLPVPSGEASKSVQMATELWQAMLAEHTDRGSFVVAIGGGVVGDLAGFMAATFARGLPLVQVPTTLLSQVDSSVGGKTGINLPGAKNIVGAFWQPSLVAIDTRSLDTLPRREFVSGLAEVAKYGVIMLPDLFAFLEEHALAILAKDAAAITHIVAESCQAKASVVKEDERETTGRRAILNYGHTFAHALESATGYGTLLHGEAVAIGMHMAAELSLRMGRVDRAFVERQEALLQALELPSRYRDSAPDELWQVMQHDKKVEHGTLRFVLPDRLGHVELVAGVTQELACAAIEAAR